MVNVSFLHGHFAQISDQLSQQIRRFGSDGNKQANWSKYNLLKIENIKISLSTRTFSFS